MALLLGVELEHVADEHDENGDEDEEGERREGGEGDDLVDAGRVERFEAEGVERGEAEQQDEDSCGEGDDPELALIGDRVQNATSMRCGLGRNPLLYHFPLCAFSGILEGVCRF